MRARRSGSPSSTATIATSGSTANWPSINGLSVEDHDGRTLRDILPVNAPQIESVIDQVFATGEAVRDLEVTGETPQQPGVERHWLTGFYPVSGDDGTVEAVGAWVLEISERKAAEQREVLLAREVDHRAKNLLAVVQAIVTLTPMGDGTDLKTSVVGRIQALARAHSLLSESRWDGVDLRALVEEELAPFKSPSRRRIHTEGPPLKLRPAAAQSLGLVLHELATNAAKYGALSVDAGELRVEWRREQDETGSWLVIEWTESGGPEVHAPESLSFGSNIIRASVERQLRGKVTKDWRPEGLLCTLRIPSSEAVPGSESCDHNFLAGKCVQKGAGTGRMSHYRGTAEAQDRAVALAGVLLVHAALAAAILSGLNVHSVAHTIERLKTFDISEPPPPPPPPPPPAQRSERAKDEAGAPAKKAEATPVVAPKPKIVVPARTPIVAAPIAGRGSAPSSGAAAAGTGTGAGGSGQRTRRRRHRRLLALHAGANAQQDPRPRISPHFGRANSARQRDHKFSRVCPKAGCPAAGSCGRAAILRSTQWFARPRPVTCGSTRRATPTATQSRRT